MSKFWTWSRRVQLGMAVGLLVLIASTIAWRHRPLSAIDAKLVGIWSQDSDPSYQLRFTPFREAQTRRIDATPGAPVKGPDEGFKHLAVWSTSGTSLDMRYKPDRKIHRLEFDGADRIRIDSDSFSRVPQ